MNFKKKLALLLAALSLFGSGAEAQNQTINTSTREKLCDRIVRLSREKSVKLDNNLPAAGRMIIPCYTAEDFAQKKKLKTIPQDWGGKLIFSDCPEYVKEPGILYRDIICGEARVYYYHLNDTRENYKLAVVLESASGKGTIVTVKKGVISDHIWNSGNYFHIGRGMQLEWFSEKSELNQPLYVGGSGKLLSLKMDQRVLKPTELVGGAFDFVTAEPVRVTVLMYPAKERPLEYLPKAKVLPRDKSSLRGTYEKMNRTLRLERPYNPETDKIACIDLANNRSDVFLRGIDATDGKPSTDYGNYGVDYRIEVKVSTAGRTHYYLTPLGTVFGGAIRVHYGEKGQNTALFVTPERRGEFERNDEDFLDLGSYDNKERLWFDFSPPGGSNLPARIVMVPESYRGLAPN